MPNLWSYGRLMAFADCPYSFDLHYNKKTPEAIVPIFGAGAEFHRVAEEYGRHCLAKEVGRDLDWAYARADRYDDSVLATAISNFALEMEFDWSMIAQVGEGIERWFEVPLDAGGEDILRGRVDLLMFNEVDDRLWLWDYKLGQNRYDLQWPPRQMILYAWAMYQQYEAWGTLLVILQPLMKPAVTQWELEGAPDIEWARQIISEAKAATEFPVRPGNRCGACGYVLQCPEVCPQGDFRPALRRLVDVLGIDVVADQVEKHPNTIYRWLAGKSAPRDRQRLADLLAYHYLGAVRSEEIAHVAAEQLHAMKTGYQRLQAFVKSYLTETVTPIPVGNDMEAGIFLPQWAQNGDLHLKPDDSRDFFERCQALQINPLAQDLFKPAPDKIGAVIQTAKQELVAAETELGVFVDPKRAQKIAALEKRCTPVIPSVSFRIRKIPQKREPQENGQHSPARTDAQG